MQIAIDGNIYTHGDEITLISNHNHRVIQGKFSVNYNGRYYICHNDRYYYDGGSPNESFGYSYCYELRNSLLDEGNVLMHKVDLEINSNGFEHLKAGIQSFILRQPKKISMLFVLNLGLLDNYNSITQSEQQGHVELHSTNRKKKLSIKIGRLIRKLNVAYNEIVISNPKNKPDLIKDSDIEAIHNKWMGVHINSMNYKILNGVDIYKGYDKDNYFSKDTSTHGTLHNSCMCNKFEYLNLYVNNPDKISLIVFYEESKICGRALIWKCDDGNTYYDRVYYTYDWYESLMKQICEKEGFQPIYNKQTTATIKLQRLDFDFYPYLDTFYGVSFKDNILKYSYGKNFRYELRCTNGQINENTHITE